MKRTFVVLMAIMFAGMAVSVQAADVTFKPGSVDLTLEPGNSAVKTLEANGNSVSAAHTIMVSVGADSVLTGDEEITHDWLVPQPNGNVVLVTSTGSNGSSSTAVNMKVQVPEGTAPGEYNAELSPTLKFANIPESLDTGTISFKITVPSENVCDEAPSFKNVEVSSSSQWAPKDKEVDIEISGTVDVATDCTYVGTYSIVDNVGEKAGDFEIGTDGTFALTIKDVMVSKKGKGKKGKGKKGKGNKDMVYDGILTVSLVDGPEGKRKSDTKGFFVKVDHDRRDKKGHNKD